MTFVSTVAQLESLYADAPPALASLAKVTDHVTADYAALIAASPFCVLATSGPEGLDCSPRGDRPGFVRLQDPRTLLLPDRRGNNRLDSLRNIVRDPRVALLFLVPGSHETLRVNGRAAVSADPALCARFTAHASTPRTVIVVAVESVYFQCARALLRSDLWNPARHAATGALPTVGTMLAEASGGREGGSAYDRALPERLRTTLY
jgi:PPOX class probable FMN-dependent enzyme